jgi:hypothetical protein
MKLSALRAISVSISFLHFLGSGMQFCNCFQSGADDFRMEYVVMLQKSLDDKPCQHHPTDIFIWVYVQWRQQVFRLVSNPENVFFTESAPIFDWGPFGSRVPTNWAQNPLGKLRSRVTRTSLSARDPIFREEESTFPEALELSTVALKSSQVKVLAPIHLNSCTRSLGLRLSTCFCTT